MLDPNNLAKTSGSRGRRLAAEFVAGFIGALLGAVLGLVIGTIIGGNLYGPGGGGMSAGTNAVEATGSGEAFAGMYGYEATGWVGLIVGVIVGGSAGVYWAGRFGPFSGSYVVTILTSVLAVLVGAGVLLATGDVAREDWLFNKHPWTLPILFLMTLLGGMLGLEVTRRQKQPPGSGST